jgi:hypothetical protein
VSISGSKCLYVTATKEQFSGTSRVIEVFLDFSLFTDEPLGPLMFSGKVIFLSQGASDK